MKKIFLDTNILVRFLIQNNLTQYQHCAHLIQAVEQGQFLPYSSTVVFLEALFILTKNYKVPHKIAMQKIEILLEIKSLTIIEKTNLKQALILHKKTKVKLADCLIASQLPQKATLITFNKDFKKLPIKSQTPKEFLNS